MKNIETQYRSLIKELLDAPFKSDRTGTGTYSLFGKTLEHDMSAGFPLLLSKRVSFKAAKFELLWILQGRTDMKYLKDIVREEVEEPFDHKNLNLDTPEFKDLNPTAENIAVVCYNLLRDKIDSKFKLTIRLWETENNIVEYNGF